MLKGIDDIGGDPIKISDNKYLTMKTFWKDTSMPSSYVVRK